MRVCLDGTDIEVPQAATLGELLEGIGPRIDPARIVTHVEVDGAPADSTDAGTLAAWRLGGREAVAVGTETPHEFARSRRAEIGGHLVRIADGLAAAAGRFAAGETTDANRILAAATRDLSLVLELDQQLATLESVEPGCGRVIEVVGRIGAQLTDAEQGQRWSEVARLLADELVPALRLHGA